MGTQLELFDKKEIPKELKELLCGNGENDFMLGVQMAIPMGISAFECFKTAFSNVNLEMPYSDLHIHLQIKFNNLTFYLFENDSDTFHIVVKPQKEANCFELEIAEWGENDDCFSMQNKLRSKIKEVLTQFHYEFKKFLK